MNTIILVLNGMYETWKRNKCDCNSFLEFNLCDRPEEQHSMDEGM